MAIRSIISGDNKALRMKSRPVVDFTTRLHILLDDMRETLISADGRGLAAPQVGVLRRVAIVVDTTIDSDSFEDQVIELINPCILESIGQQSGSEGCLSIPGEYGLVTRPEVVNIKAQDRFGNHFEFSGSEIMARAICHEIDHLDGVLYIDIAERMLTPQELEEMSAH